MSSMNGDAFGADAGAAIRGAQRLDVLLARLMHDLWTHLRGNQRKRGRHDLIQRCRAEAAADDQ